MNSVTSKKTKLFTSEVSQRNSREVRGRNEKENVCKMKYKNEQKIEKYTELK